MANKTVKTKFTLDDSQYQAGARRVKGSLVEFGATSKRVHGAALTDVQATSGALRLLDGGIQNNIRSAERFLASIKGVGAAMKLIYPGIGLIAVGAVIARGVTELTQFVKKAKEAGDEFRRSFQQIQNASRLSNDELAKTNVELQNQINKVTGKHENVLAAELADARVEADKLAISAAAAAKEIKDLLEKNQAGILARAMGSDSTTEVFGNVTNFQNLKAQAHQDQMDALHRGDKASADDAQKRYEQLLKNERAYLLDQRSLRTGYVRYEQTDKGPVLARANKNDYGAGTYASVNGDQTRNLTAINAALGLNYDQSDRIGEDAQHQKLSGTLKGIQDSKNLAQKQMEAFRQQYAEFTSSLVAGPDETEQEFHARSLASDADFWVKKLLILKRGTDNYKAVQKELDDILKQSNQLYAEAQNERIKMDQEQAKKDAAYFGANGDQDLSRSSNLDGANQGKDVNAMLAGMNESVAVANQNADAWAEAQISIGLAAGQISKYDAALQTLQLHRQQYDRATASISASRASLVQRYGSPDESPEARAAFAQLDNQQAQVEGTYKVQSAQDQQGLNAQTPFGAWKGALDQFVQQSRDTASQVKEIWSSALSSVNEEIVKIISTRHNYGVGREFGNIGAGIFRGVAAAGLQKGEGALLGALGLGGGKPDGSSSKPFHVVMAGAAGVGSSVASGVSNAVGGIGGFLGKVGGFFSGLGFASGGMPPVGMASLVGENGPELFVPHTAGTVVPNGAFGSSIHHHISIDARGAADPAATQSLVRREIYKALPAITSASMHAAHESNSRKPSSARR